MGFIECNATTFNGTGQGIYPESLTHDLVLLVSCVYRFFSCHKIQRDKETKSQRVKETKRQQHNKTKSQNKIKNKQKTCFKK